MAFTLASPVESAQLNAGLIAASGLPDGYAAEATQAMASVTGSFSPNVVVTLADALGTLAGSYLYDYYYRIWVIPGTIEAQNPVIGAPIPFAIWNAYPQPADNAVVSILTTGAEGLELDFDVGETFAAIEYRTVNITITPAAPIEIDAAYEFNFDEGVGFFYFRATIADFVQMVPDPPIAETWEWLTDVIGARNGKEQRIALRASPRRSTQYSFMLENETERRRQYNRWFKSLASRIVLPYYQYATGLTAPSTPGDSTIYFEAARTDLRDGEFALIYDKATEEGFLVKMGVIGTDSATLDVPLTFAVNTGMIIAPAFTSRLYDRTGLSMKHVTGSITVQADALDARTLFARPGSTAVITTYDGLPVLDQRPISVGDNPETFEVDYEVVDGRAGIVNIFSAWLHAEVATVRKWTIRRIQNPEEMDWWRDFLDLAKGRQNPFLMPTWFADLVPAEAPGVAASTLKIEGTDYAVTKASFESFKRLQIETGGGIIYRKVLSTTDNGDGTTTLNLDAPFGANPEDLEISKVSFLNLTRLATDRVNLVHERIRTQIELATRTVDQ